MTEPNLEAARILFKTLIESGNAIPQQGLAVVNFEVLKNLAAALAFDVDVVRRAND